MRASAGASMLISAAGISNSRDGSSPLRIIYNVVPSFSFWKLRGLLAGCMSKEGNHVFVCFGNARVLRMITYARRCRWGQIIIYSEK